MKKKQAKEYAFGNIYSTQFLHRPCLKQNQTLRFVDRIGSRTQAKK
jgi:hypothetical protein